MLDFVNICREELCLIDELHEAHGRVQRVRRGSFVLTMAPQCTAPKRAVDNARGQLLLDITLAAVSHRVLKPFGVIYTDVLDDYGTISESAVYRALADCVDLRSVAAVAPPGVTDRLRKGGFARAGYIRFDSPLLWQRDGLVGLMEQASELNQDLVDANGASDRARVTKANRAYRRPAGNAGKPPKTMRMADGTLRPLPPYGPPRLPAF